MSLAIHKTLSFTLLIVIGLLLKRKITNKEQLGGIKTLILSIALPATIFIALLKIDIKPALIFLPIIALFVNVVMLGAARFVLPFFSFPKDSPEFRSLVLLLPSFAPGLSCFPFLAEYFGEESLAHAALADVGNKVFVLIFLYLLAMHWYYQLLAKNQSKKTGEKGSQLKSLLTSLGKEPVNLVMIIALVLLCFGMNLSSLPVFLQDSISRMSALMTPLVLLFIGLAVKVKRREMVQILQLLMVRSGFAFLLSGLLVFFIPATLPAAMVLVAVIFPQSACSFWPFAHITAIESLESKQPQRTFNLDLALNLLAFSLPFSTIIILGICSFGSFFVNPVYLLLVGTGFIGISSFSVFLVKKKSERKKIETAPSPKTTRLIKIKEVMS
ncbi:MAG: permease [Saprospiraceae bacterium]